MILAGCSNIAEISDMSWYFANGPPSYAWVSSSIYTLQFVLKVSDMIAFHFAWIFFSIYFCHFFLFMVFLSQLHRISLHPPS